MLLCRLVAPRGNTAVQVSLLPVVPSIYEPRLFSTDPALSVQSVNARSSEKCFLLLVLCCRQSSHSVQEQISAHYRHRLNTYMHFDKRRLLIKLQKTVQK